jgi:hypothetical protein
MTSSNFVGCWTGSSAGLVPVQNAIDVARGAAKQIGEIGAIGQQASARGKQTVGICRGQPMPVGKRKDLLAVRQNEYVRHHDEAGSRHECRDRGFDFRVIVNRSRDHLHVQ